jgi:hypothetical protein
MKLVYVTSDRSFWELARLTLHGAGIETFESDIDAAITSVGSPFMLREYRLYVLDSAQAPEAVKLIREIGGYFPEVGVLPNGWWVKALCVALSLVLVLLMAWGSV